MALLSLRLLTSGVLLGAACGRGASDAAGRAVVEPPADSTVAALAGGAEAMYWRGEFDSARGAWRTALARAGAVGDSLSEPGMLMWLGLVAYRQGDQGQARTLGERALTLKLERGLHTELARSYNALGLVAREQGRLSDAAQLFRQSSEAAEAHGDETGVARAIINLGLVFTEFADFARARESFTSVRVAARRLDDGRMEGNALVNLAALDIRLGDPRAALGSLAEARRLYQALDYGTGEQHALGQLATLYAGLGEPSRAFAALDSALDIARRQGMRQEEASNLDLIGGIYADVGDSQRALRYYAEALEIVTALGLAPQVAALRRSEGSIHARLGNLPLARLSVQAALAAHRAAGARLEELDDLLLLAEIAAMAGDRRESDTRLAAGRRVARAISSPYARLSVGLSEARIADWRHQARRVLAALKETEPDLVLAEAAVAWEVHALRTRAWARLGRADSAISTGRRAVAAVERLRDNLQPGPLRTTFVTERALVYSDLTVALLRLGRTEEAFEVAGAARGRALIEHLTVVRRDAAAAPLRDLLAAEELLRRIDALLSRVAAMEPVTDSVRGGTDATRRDLAQQIGDSRSEYESLLLRIEQRHPVAAALLATRRVGAAEVMAVLRPEELLVQYLLTPDRMVIFAATAGGIRSLTSEISASELTSRIRLARDLFSQREGIAPASAGGAVGAGLYEALITPLRDAGLLAGVRRLIIVPHNALVYMPFAALRDPASGRYLSDDHAIVILPSAGALPLLRAEPEVKRTATAAPVGGAAFAPFPDRLPATRQEAREFRRAVPRSVVRSGGQASEAALRRALERGGPVHVATHGVMNARNPMFSRLELARGHVGRAAAADDGRLEIHEVLALSIRSPLVFLSGCETGLGSGWSTDFARGEDYATLAQAFLYAGARNVVATLWRIDDEGAAVFTEGFYRYLRTLAPPEALAAAQREMRRQPRYEHPYYWAGYMLSGGGTSPLSRVPRNPGDASR